MCNSSTSNISSPLLSEKQRIQPTTLVSKHSTLEGMDAIRQALNNLDPWTGEDRISDLPESVLSHILSRLPTQDAVRTCVLSKTWEMKWTCIYNLHFNDELLSSNHVTEKEKFRSFILKVLHHCGDSQLQNFTLIFSHKYDPSHVNALISAALSHDVKRIYLRYHRSERLEIPSSFMGCKSLKEAKIIMPCTLKLSQVTSFENLRILYISRANFVNESNPDATNLSFTFPVLEEFTLVCCIWYNVKFIRIEAPRLSSFQLAWCSYENGRDHLDDHLDNYQIVILAACLTKFNWAGNFVDSFILPRPPLVCDAVIDNIFDPNNFLKSGIGAVMLLTQLSTLIHLELSVDVAEALDLAGEIGSLPVFNQLTCLKMESRFTGSTKAVIGFLRKTPNLRYLEVHISSLSWRKDDIEMIGTLPLCVMFCLEQVSLNYHLGHSLELQLVKLFLRNAHALQLMHICAPEISTISKILIRLQLFLASRASSDVAIKVE